MTIRASIIWAVDATTPATLGCALVSTIVGPTAIAGSSNADPLFVNVAGDFHVKTGSPAIDAIDSGPSTDAAGNPRPVGVRFDLGAFESQ